jgi:uncharacterized protein (DUF1015 family)
MYHVYQGGAIALLQQAISHQLLTIADGHHRLRRAVEGLSTLKHRPRQDRSEVIAFVSTVETAERCIRPIHRCYRFNDNVEGLFDQLAQHFHLKEVAPSSLASGKPAPELPTLLFRDHAYQIESVHGDHGAEQAIDQEAWTNETSDSEILFPVLKNLAYSTDFRLTIPEVLQVVNTDANTLGLLCRGVSLERFRRAAVDERLLPPKSILFSPKPLAALMLQESNLS